MSLFREAVLGPAFTPGSGSGNPYNRSDSLPSRRRRRRDGGRRHDLHRDEPVLKTGLIPLRGEGR